MRFIGGEEFKLILHSEQHLAWLQDKHDEEIQDLYDDISPVMLYMDPSVGRAVSIHKRVDDAAIEICEVRDRQRAERGPVEERVRTFRDAMQQLPEAHRKAIQDYLNNPLPCPSRTVKRALEVLRGTLEERQGATA